MNPIQSGLQFTGQVNSANNTQVRDTNTPTDEDVHRNSRDAKTELGLDEHKQ